MKEQDIIANNKLIAVFMGWYIEVKITEDYPNLEVHTSRQKDSKNWDSSRTVFLNEPNVEESRLKTDNDLWDNLCNNSYGRAGQYNKLWDKIMPVVEKIESLDYFCMINRWTSVYTGEEKEGRRIQITSVEGFSKINNTYLAVLAFINWYNSQKT